MPTDIRPARPLRAASAAQAGLIFAERLAVTARGVIPTAGAPRGVGSVEEGEAHLTITATCPCVGGVCSTQKEIPATLGSGLSPGTRSHVAISDYLGSGCGEFSSGPSSELFLNIFFL